jgi:hypothetical protein
MIKKKTSKLSSSEKEKIGSMISEEILLSSASGVIRRSRCGH